MDTELVNPMNESSQVDRSMANLTDEFSSFDADDVTDAAKRAFDAAGDFYSEWREFALRKNIFDVTVGLMVATALSNITISLSTDIFMPILISSWSGSNIQDMYVILRQGKRKCSNCYKTLDEAAEDGAVTLNYGKFLDTVMSFLFTTVFLFIIYKTLLKLKKKVEVEMKQAKILAQHKTENTA